MPSASSPDHRAAQGRAVAEALRRGATVTNRQLDALYPAPIRTLSASYWTPVRVAVLAARMLVDVPGARVLDIGSGAGKFCCVGAASTTGVFHGVEQRSELVHHARDLAKVLGTDRATFTQGLFDELSPKDYDGFYLFNPFEENEDRSLAAADRTAHPGDDWYQGDVQRAQAFLARARPGARVVTYNGLGGPLPEGYVLSSIVKLRRDVELWVKLA